MKIDADEKDLLKSVERGEWKSVVRARQRAMGAWSSDQRGKRGANASRSRVDGPRCAQIRHGRSLRLLQPGGDFCPRPIHRRTLLRVVSVAGQPDSRADARESDSLRDWAGSRAPAGRDIFHGLLQNTKIAAATPSPIANAIHSASVTLVSIQPIT
jgi:hypothetical protein